MSKILGTDPQVQAFLQDARDRPEDDTPRLVLADFLEERGDHDRGEFIRLQCRLGDWTTPLDEPQRQEMKGRCDGLLGRRGGGWLGPLWRWPVSPMAWHRGLLAMRLPRRFDPEELEDILGWIDTALFVLHGRAGFRRVTDFMGRSGVNHLHLDWRSQLREGTLLEMLAGLPESACLRSLSIHWPLALLRRPDGDGDSERGLSVAAVSEGFLATLLGELPVGRHLTHLGTSRPFGTHQNQLVRDLGVEPVDVQDRLWMHRLPPTAFRARRAAPTSSCPPAALS